MFKRLMVLLTATVACLVVLSGCNSKSEADQKTAELVFADAKVETASRDGWFGGRYANFTITASVKNETENPLNESNMPVLLSSSGSEEEVKPKLSEEKLLPGETCDITYDHEFDVRHEDLPTLSFSCKLSVSGLEDAEKELNDSLKGIVDGYAKKDEEEEAAAEAQAEEERRAKEAVENSKGKTADEGLKAAEAANYTAVFKDSAGVDVTSKVEDASNGSDVHSAKISAVEVSDKFFEIEVTFTLDYTDPDAQKEREEKAAAEAAAAQKAEEQKVVITADNNEEFARVLAVSDPVDPIVIEFAKNYNGRTIEFDAMVVDVMPHGNANTRFDYLLGIGDDYTTASTHGPCFKYEDVNYYDFHWVGSSPDSVPVETKLHCKAIVGELNTNSGLFFLDPVETSLR